MRTTLLNQRMLVLLLLGATLLSTASPTLAGERDDAQAGKEIKDARGQRLLDTAIGADGEFVADLVLRLLETDQIRSPKLRRQAVDIAIARISSAEELFPLEYIYDYDNGTREGYREGGLGQYPVDALSLRCRAVVQLIKSDPAAARFTLTELGPDLDLARESCGDIVVPKPEVFYATLREVVANCYGPDERRDGVHWDVVGNYLSGISSPTQIVPACQLLVSVGAPRDVLDRLATDLATGVAKVGASPRVLFEIAFRSKQVGAMRAALDAVRSSDESHRRLRDALRDFVLRSLSAPRCADRPEQALPDEVVQFNEALFADRPILRDEVAMTSRAEAANFASFWASAESKRRLRAFQDLNTARREMKPDADLTQWKAEYLKVLGGLRDWTSVSEPTEFDYIAAKTSIVGGMVEIAYDDAVRAEAMKDFVSMMRHANASRVPQHVLLWFVAITLSRATEPDRFKALESFKASGPRTLAVYAALQLEGVDVFKIGAPTAAP